MARPRTLTTQRYGRYLLKSERVHHLNGDKSDNRICNLELFNTEQDHQAKEFKLQMFSKQLLYGGIHKPYRHELLRLFEEYEPSAQ